MHPLTNHALICVSESATSGSVTCAFVSQCEISLPYRPGLYAAGMLYHVCCMSGRLLGYTITNENDGVRCGNRVGLPWV